VLAALGERFGARLVVPFFMAIDPQVHRPELCEKKWALNFLGTYSPGRQATVEALLNEPARELAERSFAVAGGRYPDRLRWPANVDRLDHLPPRAHRGFYCEGRFTLNVNRREIGRVGHTPSLRLFEAAACGVPVITDRFDGVEQLFTPGTEILVARSSEDVLRFIQEISDEECREIGERARARVLAEHTLETRAHTLMACIEHVRPGWVERAAQHATVHP
jgi:spore maturation protein CgeB